MKINSRLLSLAEDFMSWLSSSRWCLILLLGLCVVKPSVAGDESKDFLKQWQIDKRWTGDFDAMTERRLIRVLVVHNKMFFFVDRGQIRGGTHDLLLEFEKYINKKQKTGTRKIRVVFIPVPRDQLLPALVEGRGDLAAANLTITKERKKLVDFGDPLLNNVKEILVTGPSAPVVENLDSLSGKEIHVRKASSYYVHLIELNEYFEKQGKEPVKVIPVSDYLEDSDLLEMVNAGLIPMIIVDDHKSTLWAEIFEDISVHPEISIHAGGQIAWAFRKKSPELGKVVKGFVKGHKKGTLLGNVLFKRYLKGNKWARNAINPAVVKKFRNVVDLFKRYSDQYGFDYLMIGALAYQESGLDHRKRSRAGAVGIMQILPSTAADKNVGIPDAQDLEKNIHAGVKYLRFIRDRYFNHQAIDSLNQVLFAFASYNAGPAKVARLRKEAEQMKLDPNVWFGNVEVVAAKRIGRETVQYVSNIYKYYVAYKLARLNLETKQNKTTKK